MGDREDASATVGEISAFPYRDLVAIPDFRRLWLGDFASQTADRMAFVAITVLAYGEGVSSLGLGAVMAAYFLPAIVVGVPGGVAADRFPRRTVMVAAEAVRVMVALALSALGGGFWLVPMVLLFSSFTYLFYPARQATIPLVVPGHALLPANAAMSANLILGFAAGPSLAAISIALAGAREALVLSALIMAVGVAIITTLREPACRCSAREGLEGGLSSLREGAVAIIRDPGLYHGYLVVASVMMAVGAGAVGLVVLGDEVLGMGEEGFSYLLTSLALGTLAGAVSVGGSQVGPAKGRFLVFAALLAGVLLVVLTLSERPWAALAVMFLVGIAAAMVLVPFSTMLQEGLGDHVLGTSFGLLSIGLTAPMVVGMVLAGTLIDAFGVKSTFQALGVYLLVAGLAAYGLSGLWRGGRGRKVFAEAPR